MIFSSLPLPLRRSIFEPSPIDRPSCSLERKRGRRRDNIYYEQECTVDRCYNKSTQTVLPKKKKIHHPCTNWPHHSFQYVVCVCCVPMPCPTPGPCPCQCRISESNAQYSSPHRSKLGRSLRRPSYPFSPRISNRSHPAFFAPGFKDSV